MKELVQYQADAKQPVTAALALFSVLPHAPVITDGTVMAWSTVLCDAGIRPDEVLDGARNLMQSITAWPAPSQLIESCRELRRAAIPAFTATELPGPRMTREQRDEILRGLKNPAFALEVIEGRGESRRYTISEDDDDAVITDEDIALRDEQIRRLRGEA